MSTEPASHPSYLALDRAGLGLTSAAVQAHLASCDVCRDYVDSLREPASVQDLSEVRARIAKLPKPRRTANWAWLGAPLALAAAVTLYLGIHPQPDLPTSPSPSPVYIGEKGFSSVWIYVKRGSNTALWDGKRPVFAGDRLRLKVDPGRYRRVEVYSIKDPNSPERLYEGSLAPGQSATLPDAWEVDTEPGDERLLVVFSNEPTKPVWSDWLAGKVPPGVTLLPFVLPKSGAADPNPGSTGP